ncbi:MAG: aspartate kinase [Puniceicoccaceae bacterium MED-G31]|jgi:aspartate kinase|nr:MAG: aspartate kinase [Puniceicoccaceae bacterium MED-G31]HBO57031.1 aspartate kinase [Opitutae bacterium]|tara:strand:- start:7027 stop:8250 length:1224 start_codon:yes stop_codon:yes gene_type:complete
MALIVQKYGGTSVGDVNRIKSVAQRVKETYAAGNQVIVVVSARSGVTNELIGRAKSLNPDPDDREMDLLLTVGEQETIALTAMALHALGVPAVSRTGKEAGILTDLAHTRARITSISGGDIKDQLDAGKVVILAGFQGYSPDGQITTLGRGGSDLSAIAISAALNADMCQIYTDVDGVYTADPRVVEHASKLSEIAYEEMLELASSGSKVMQNRAVEFAQKFDVVFEVRSSFNNNPGTIVKEEAASMEDVVVSGVALDKNQAKVVVSDLPDHPGTAAELFNALADAGISVDMIVQNIGREGKANMTFTVPRDAINRAEKTVVELFPDEAQGKLFEASDIAKVSVVGVGMRTHTGVAAKLFAALAQAGVNIQLVSTSEIKIAVGIDPKDAEQATRIVHDAFDLGVESS